MLLPEIGGSNLNSRNLDAFRLDSADGRDTLQRDTTPDLMNASFMVQLPKKNSKKRNNAIVQDDQQRIFGENEFGTIEDDQFENSHSQANVGDFQNSFSFRFRPKDKKGENEVETIDHGGNEIENKLESVVEDETAHPLNQP